MPDEQTPQLDLGLKKALDNLEKDPYLDLAKQVKAEYDLAWNHQKPKKDEALLRLKLYNNQKRDKSAAGDTTMFTIHQTLLASLYVDKLQSEWVGREEGDDEVANNLTAMADYDYDEMGKDETDFDWIWDTLFFGRAPLNFSEYIRDPDTNIFLPVPESIDPITFLHDPRGVSINGNRMGRNACRFYGREIKMGRDEMEKHPHFLANLDFTKIHFGSGTRSLIEEGVRARADAQGNQYERNKAEAKLGVNGEYDITEWCTHFKFGGVVKKCKVWLANNRKEVVGLQIFKGDKWTVFDRPLYPTSHDWDGTSIPDLTEDKQRARAVAQNLGMQAMKADLYPMYIYDTNKIKNKNDLAFNFNKFIPSDGDASNAAFALRKAFPNLPLLNFIYNSLDMSAQKATATPEIQQGQMSQEKRTLGEINIVASKVDTRYSLSAKVFGWSERRFWLQWYNLYKENFKEGIDEKIVRLVGAFGDKWRPFTKENIVTKRLDPDVKIESSYVSRAKQLEERQGTISLLSIILQDPTSNRRYAERKVAKQYGWSKDEIERLLPPTIDERIAEDQNAFLSKNKTVPVLPEDDHNVHLEIHSKASATPATYAHVETHKKALSIKKTKPELFPVDQSMVTFQNPNQRNMPATQLPGQVRAVQPSQTSNQSAPAPMMQ